MTKQTTIVVTGALRVKIYKELLTFYTQVTICHTEMIKGWYAKCNEVSYSYITFFMLNSAEHEICPASKSQITNNSKFFLAKHS